MKSLLALLLLVVFCQPCMAELFAGVAKRDVTDRSGPVNDPLYVKVLALKSGETQLVIVTVDAVAIGEIGPIPNDYLPKVQQRLAEQWKLGPESLVINASHCHGRVVGDLDKPTGEAIDEAMRSMVPVKIGFAFGHEDGIMENRRLKLKSGGQSMYAMPTRYRPMMQWPRSGQWTRRSES